MKPERTIAFYEGVKALVGNETANNTFRLFMVPNMGHCGNGDGPNEFGGASQTLMSGKDPEHNAFLALEAWVEMNHAPDKIIATRYRTFGGAHRAEMSRPLCPYPTVARWNGHGDIHDDKNFTCGVDSSRTPR